MLRASFIPSRPQRQLRDLTRYRRTLTHERTREKQRAEKLLEDAQIKLSSVISDIFGASGRAMLDALIGGQASPHQLAALARGSMRAKTSVLQEALTGHFTDHHAFMLGMMLARIDALTAQIDALTTRISQAIARSPTRSPSSMRSPASASPAAQDLLAEIGTDMARFPTPGHLVSWAKFAPTARQSARPKQGRRHRQGQPLARRHPRRGRRRRRPDQTFLGLPLQRIARRRGASNAPWSPSATPSWSSPGTWLSDPAAHFHPPGPDWRRPPRPAAPQTTAHHRTRTEIRQESHPPRHRLTQPPCLSARTGSADAPPGAAGPPALAAQGGTAQVPRTQTAQYASAHDND